MICLLLATVTVPVSIELIDPKEAIIIENQTPVSAPSYPQPQENITEDRKELIYE